MKTLAPELLLEEILSFAKESQGTSLYNECQVLSRGFTWLDYQELVSTLDTYFYDVWSAGNGVKKLARKPDAWLLDLKAFLEQSFFARYPQYALLKDAINSKDTPQLFRRLKTLDMLRRDVARYVSELLGERRSGTLSA